jgi:type IV pilus assembly protein PilW
MKLPHWNSRATAEAGFTLTELMVALAISSTLIAAGFGVLIANQKAARINGQVVNTQSTGRNALDMITADLKLAGFGMVGLPAGTAVGNCQINGTPRALVPRDNAPGGADAGPDRISIVVPMTNSLAAAGPLWQVAVPPPAPPQVGDPNAPVPIAAIPVPAGTVAAMQNAIGNGGAGNLAGTVVSIGGVAGSVMAAPGGTTLNLATPIQPVGGAVSFGNGTQVYILQCITYQVIPPPDNFNLCNGNAPCLVRGVAPGAPPPGQSPDCNVANPNPLLPHPCVAVMDGVEDLQLAYACDGCDPRPTANNGNPDGQPDDLNQDSVFGAQDFLFNWDWFGLPIAPYGTFMTPDKMRLVQVTLVARQLNADQGLGEGNAIVTSNSTFLTVGDHIHANGLFAAGDMGAPAAQQAYFQLRRRVFSRTVELRNQRS